MPAFRPAVLFALLPLACAPQNVPMDVAEAQCVQVALNGGGPGGLTVGMSTGTGGWNNGYWGGGWGWGGYGGGGVGMTVVTEIPSGRSPASAYNACVQRRTGLPPVTPFNKRPEIAG